MHWGAGDALMSEQGNIETTQRIFEIFQAGEHDELPGLIDENVTVTVLDSPQISGPRGFAGIQGMLDAFSRTAGIFESTRLRLRSAIAVDAEAVLAEAEFTARARQDLEPISLSLWFVFRFAAGRVVSIDEFDDEERARAAAGAPVQDSSAV
jgi:ketosteroid isomerase-like protein